MPMMFMTGVRLQARTWSAISRRLWVGVSSGVWLVLERAEERDRLWFEQHSRRCFRMRYMVIGEFGLHREDPFAGNAGIWNRSYTIVFRSRRSGRVKKWPFWISLF